MADNQFLALLEKEEASIKAMLPTWISPERWWALMVEVSKSRDLQRIAQSNPTSLIAAVKKLADWGLELDGDEAIILPYGDEAVPQAMYRGLIRRAIEAGAVSHVVADLIKEGDDIEIVSGTDGRKLIHRPKFNLKGGKRAIIGAYALVTLPNGTIDFELFESDDIEKVKGAALRMAKRRKADADLSPAWKMFEGEMIKKSILRRALKRFRGKRDTEAGKRFANLTDGTAFDAETTGEELPPDIMPTAAKESWSEQSESITKRELELQAADKVAERTKPSGSKLSLTPDKPVAAGKASSHAEPVPPATIKGTEIEDELIKKWRGTGHKLSELGPWLEQTFGIDDLGDLLIGKVTECSEAMDNG